MQIFLNGQAKEIEDSITLEELLSLMKLEAAHVAVELNREIITKPAFSDTYLKAEDKVEVVHFVGGG